MINFLARACASLGGVGFFPIMPGTAGSLVTVFITWLFYTGETGPLLTAAAIIFFIGLVTVQYATQGQSDPSWIVIDEAVGMLLALVGVPPSGKAFFAAFVLFRILDIYKPFGINILERLPGAWGVMLDDILAGLVAAGILQTVMYVMPF
ncbi:phosphatidylglycerophosphatase A [Candidatus Dependentiae bacterium]|nr:phosphatidylglycerophosphatase A [Candidatus Dependentiae bacterium]